MSDFLHIMRFQDQKFMNKIMLAIKRLIKRLGF